MKLLLDEDMQSNSLVRLLRLAGHDVETVSGGGIAGQSDATVLQLAKKTGRVLLTRNGNDFLELHAADNGHFGILVEYQDADASKNMNNEEIVAAINKIDESGWNLAGEFSGINAWR